jgi:tripartite-type tricarboxylate transporter receptor subunit TctC
MRRLLATGRKPRDDRRRPAIFGIAGIAVLLTVPCFAAPVDYPTRPVRLVVGFAAGGPLDVGARLTGRWLTRRLGQPFFIEDRPGGSSNLAAEEVIRARPDGYTLLECASPNAFNTILYDNLSFDFFRDIAPVASVSRIGGVMEVAPDFPMHTVPEFIAYAKANPGKIRMASAGPTSSPGLWGALFASMAGIKVTPVQYSGSGPALIDLMSGRVNVMFDVASTAIGPAKAGQVRALAVTTAKAIPQLPDIPPVGNFLPGYEAVTWQGIAAPRDTPSAIVALLNKAVNTALADRTFDAQLVELGYAPFPSSPSEFVHFITAYTAKWRKVIRGAGIKAQ